MHLPWGLESFSLTDSTRRQMRIFFSTMGFTVYIFFLGSRKERHNTMKYLFVGTMTANLVFLLFSVYLLPERVAMHFAMSGIPDQWGSRTEYLITMSILVCLLSTIFWGLRWINHVIPVTWINIPNKDYWLSENNRAEMYRKVDCIMEELGSVVLLCILLMQGMVVTAHFQESVHMNAFLLIGGIVFLLMYNPILIIRLFLIFQAPEK